MAEWRFSDGTVLRSGGVVEGSSALAKDLSDTIEAVRAGEEWYVPVAPPPGGGWPLDPASDFTLNALAMQEALRPFRQMSAPVTDYVEGDDVPDEVREMRRAAVEDHVPGRIY